MTSLHICLPLEQVAAEPQEQVEKAGAKLKWTLNLTAADKQEKNSSVEIVTSLSLFLKVSICLIAGASLGTRHLSAPCCKDWMNSDNMKFTGSQYFTAALVQPAVL